MKPPFEIYDRVHIADANGHLCTADDPELADKILTALNQWAKNNYEPPETGDAWTGGFAENH